MIPSKKKKKKKNMPTWSVKKMNIIEIIVPESNAELNT